VRAITIKILAVQACPVQLMGLEIKSKFISTELTNPSRANIDRKIIAYETNEVAQGKNIAVRKNPLNFRSLSFKRLAKISDNISISGT